MTHTILQYQTRTGKVPFREWLVNDTDLITRARIRARLDRLRLGNFGDCKHLGGGVYELRFHFGPGYRVYFGLDRKVIVILLWGGDKSGQRSDVLKAQAFWNDYLGRS